MSQHQSKVVRLRRRKRTGHPDYYNIHVTQDLFGDWQVVCEWGTLHQHADMQTHRFDRYRDAAHFANRAYLETQSRGYTRD